MAPDTAHQHDPHLLGHDEERELPAYESMLASMQLVAIGLHGWVKRATLCSFPITAGVNIIWVFLLGRAALAALEIFDIFDIIFQRVDWKDPFYHMARVMLVISCIGDLTAALLGFFVVYDRRVVLAMLTVFWLLTHTLGGLLFSVVAAWLDVMFLGPGWTLIILFLTLVCVDFYCFMVSLQNLLAVTLKGTVAPSALVILEEAEQTATQSGSRVLNRNHIICALLQDELSLQRLRLARVDTDGMKRELGPGSIYLAGTQHTADTRKIRRLRLASDAADLFTHATTEQWRVGDNWLTADHLLLALCDRGQVVLTPPKTETNEHPDVAMKPHIYPAPEVAEMRAGIEETRLHNKVPHGPPGAPVFGCLPLEETVGVYITLQIVVCVVSLICLVFYGRGVGVLMRLRTVDEMRVVEYWASLAGMVIGILALLAMFNQRYARREVREAAYKKGVRWDAELDEAFFAVRKDADAPDWLSMLKWGGTMLAVNLVWNVIQLFIDVPVIMMFLIYGNICNSHSFAMGTLYPGYASMGEGPMQCTARDGLIITLVALMICLQIYMSYCMLALWHQYAYGWTTTDLRGSSYLDPFSAFPEGFIRALSGLPRSAQRRLSGPEGKPIVL